MVHLNYREALPRVTPVQLVLAWGVEPSPLPPHTPSPESDASLY